MQLYNGKSIVFQQTFFHQFCAQVRKQGIGSADWSGDCDERFRYAYQTLLSACGMDQESKLLLSSIQPDPVTGVSSQFREYLVHRYTIAGIDNRVYFPRHSEESVPLPQPMQEGLEAAVKAYVMKK